MERTWSACIETSAETKEQGAGGRGRTRDDRAGGRRLFRLVHGHLLVFGTSAGPALVVLHATAGNCGPARALRRG